MTSVTFDIPIINDMIHEGDESFTLTIVSSSLPSRVSHGSPSMTTVTIVDITGESCINYTPVRVQYLSYVLPSFTSDSCNNNDILYS